MTRKSTRRCSDIARFAAILERVLAAAGAPDRPMAFCLSAGPERIFFRGRAALFLIRKSDPQSGRHPPRCGLIQRRD